MYTLIAFATGWGSKHGGINSFNADFLNAFGIAYLPKAQVICVASTATEKQIEEAGRNQVTLVPLPYDPKTSTLTQVHAETAIHRLKEKGIAFDPDRTVWLGHDRITGEAALAAAKLAGGRSALIHHMSYAHYETYAESSQVAQEKITVQKRLLEQADLVMAVGPLLRDAARDLVRTGRVISMLVPGLAEIDPQDAPNTFVAFLSARLSEDASRIKQGRLGVAAFATAQREARDEGRPDVLRRQPRLVLRGVDFEEQQTTTSIHDPETELKQFAEGYAHGVVNLHALPYTEDREQLYSELSRASVALMPSWHEGFGLVAWEAIAAGVPLIISRNSGVYRLLDEEYAGAGTGAVYAVELDGANQEPFFSPRDLESVVRLLKSIADDPNKARKQARILRNMLGERTWAACAKEAVSCFGWELEQGVIAEPTREDFSPEIPRVAPAGPADDEKGPLLIPASQWRAGIGMADSQLLRAEEALLEFDAARQPDVEKLNEWIDDPSYRLSLRLITGAGGQGKTRLALEICRQRRSQNWYAGFLDSSLESADISGTWRTLSQRKQALLIVFDYAETRQTVLLALLRIALKTELNHPVRVLLLARDGGEWWNNLSGKDRDIEGFLNGYATSGPLPLPPLYKADEERGVAFGKALAAFAETLGVSKPVFEPDLSGEHFERPLYIQIAALLALYGEQPTTAQGLTRALLNHERRYWEALLAHFDWTEPARRAEQLLALTTLAGGLVTSYEAQSYWKNAKADVIKNAEFNALFRELATLYPGSQGLQAVRPDLLGEALVSQALLRPQGDTLLDAVLTSSASHFVRRNALTVLARISSQRSDLQEILVEAFARNFTHCCADIIGVSKETRSQLPEATELAFARLSGPIKSQVSGLLAPLLDDESIELARFSCSVHEYLVGKAHEKLKQRPADLGRINQHAFALTHYSISLCRLSRYEEARVVGVQALEDYRQLIRERFSGLEDSYAWSLNSYSTILRALGRKEEALKYVGEALQIYRRLAAKDPKTFKSKYASSLSAYAVHLSDVGKFHEALEHEREAMGIYDRLQDEGNLNFVSDRAIALGNYGIYLSEVGMLDEALEYSRRGLVIMRRLAHESPDRFDPTLASSLENCALRLNKLGKFDDAAAHNGEAISMLKRLAEKDPDRFESDYASCLINDSWILGNIGNDEKSLEQSKEAMKIFERLAEKLPASHEPAYARSLTAYATALATFGKTKEAVDCSRQALAIRSRLADRTPERYEGSYAYSLNHYASQLSNVGQFELALENAKQSLQLRKQLADREPERFDDDYASSLSNYATFLSEVGKNEEAFAKNSEALEFTMGLAGRFPLRFTENLFRLSCYNAWLAWLSGQVNQPAFPDPNELFPSIPKHKHYLMLFFLEFVEGSWSSDLELKGEHYRKAIQLWSSLTRTTSTDAEPYWLVMSAWFAKFNPQVVGDSWVSSWQQYVEQRDGRIPAWLIETARRMDFEWPSLTTLKRSIPSHSNETNPPNH